MSKLYTLKTSHLEQKQHSGIILDWFPVLASHFCTQILVFSGGHFKITILLWVLVLLHSCLRKNWTKFNKKSSEVAVMIYHLYQANSYFNMFRKHQLGQCLTSNVASICSHKAVSSDSPLLRTSTAGGPKESKTLLPPCTEIPLNLY